MTHDVFFANSTTSFALSIVNVSGTVSFSPIIGVIPIPSYSSFIASHCFFVAFAAEIAAFPICFSPVP
ncbi:hypothetical protein NY2A_b245L [Paramecium bursaria Chlorella virus NY2A]|uniref:Uncharacterized protein b245L n=1 Tax=Paramecium bursaria Chlorella virus NY2A TaxID=46021 RepID=A7IWC0_PBCVN|nr:hypothetical protein NY2A_b245L [Paramecium bursaria Chlorella virus NY2A]ABT14644.1 hypothetical protein NY2A_b245L [Paramecium bursaria Chlorella virus NY2A]